jgi:hypothetical protein
VWQQKKAHKLGDRGDEINDDRGGFSRFISQLLNRTLVPSRNFL